MRIASALLLWCWILLGAGCHRTHSRRPADLSPRLTARYTALQHNDFAARAVFFHDAGLPQDAADAAQAALDEAGRTVTLLEAAGAPASELKAARADLRDAAQMGITLGKDADRGGLVIAAAMAGPRIRRRALVWGAMHLGEDLPVVDERAMLEALADEPDAWLNAWDATWSSSEDVEVPSRVLRRLGARGNRLRRSELRRDVPGGVLTQRGIEMASGIAETDPSSLSVRLLLLARAEARAGTLVIDPDLLRDTLGSAPDLSTLSRAAIRARHFDASAAAALLYVDRLLNAGLHGDAIAVLVREEARWSTPEHRDLAALALAYAKLPQGDPSGLDAWRADHPKATTLELDWAAATWVTSADDTTDPQGVRRWATAALRRVVAQDTAWLTNSQLLAAWQDPKLSRRSRQKLERNLRQRVPSSLAALQICAEHGGTRADCHALSTSESVIPATIEAYGLPPKYAPDLLRGADPSQTAWDATVEAAFAPLEGSALSVSPPLVGYRLEHLIETDASTARSLLNRLAPSLSPERRTRAHLEIEDLLAGRVEAGNGHNYWLPAPLDQHRRSGSEALGPSPEPDADSTQFIAHARDALANGAYDVALADLKVLESRLPADARAPVQARIAAVMALAGDTSEAGRLAENLPPGTPGRADVLARIATDTKRWADAAKHHADAMRTAPSIGAAAGWARASAALGRDDKAAFATMHRLRGDFWRAPAVAEAIKQGDVENLGHLARLLATLHQDVGALALGEEAAAIEPVARVAIREGYAALAAATSAAEAKSIAAPLVQLLDRPRLREAFRIELIEFLLLTGDSTRALTLARSEVPEEGIRALQSTLGIVRLHQALQAGQLDDEAAWKTWAYLNHGAFEKEHDALLSSRDGPLLGYACMTLSDMPEDPRALPACERAWKAERTESWQSAVNYAYLLLEQETPAPDKLAALFEGTPPPPFLPEAGTLRDRDDLSILHQNLAVWLEMGGEQEKAAAARLNSYAHGFEESAGNEVIPEAMYPHRHEHVRALTYRTSRWELSSARLYARIAYQALAATDVIAAQEYARTALFFAETSADGESEASNLVAADQVADFVQLVADDLGYERAERGVIARAVSLAFEDSSAKDELAELRDANPTSAVATAALANAYLDAGEPAAAAELVEQVRRAYPTNAWIGTREARLAWAQDDTERARQLFADLRAEHPRSPSVRFADLPESVTGVDGGRPSWIRTPEDFDRALATVTDAAVAGLAPRYRSHTEVAADGFFPLGWTPRGADPLSAESPQGEWISITQSARASRCEGEACLAPLRDALIARGLTHHWTRQTTVAAGDATEAMLSDASSVWVVAAVPMGGRVFTLIASAPHARARATLPAIRLLRDGFAPLDGVLPAFRAAGLRAVGRKLTDSVRLDARVARARAPAGACGVAELLRGRPGHVQAELLLDLYLSSASASARADVLACASPGSPAARRMSLVALLDDDAANHAWGAKAVHRHASAALDDARVLLTSPLEQPLSAADYFTGEELPPRGRIELALALPRATAERFVADLFRGADDEDTRVAWAIASQRPGVVPLETAAAALASDDVIPARLSAEVLRSRDPARYAQVLRERFDALPAARTEEQAKNARWLAGRIAALADPLDARRLSTAAKRLTAPRRTRGEDGSAQEALSSKQLDHLRERLASTAKRHRRALELIREGDPDADRSRDDADAAMLVANAAAERAETFRSKDDVRRAPLADLLPGPDWTFARVASPGLFARTLEDLSRRLDPADKAQRLLIDRVVQSAKQSSGFGALLAGGGLDVSAPIECASPAGDPGFVCTATVLDKNTLLTDLGRRDHGSDAGVSIPLQLSTSAAVLPAVFGVLPAVLHEMVYRDDSDDDDSSTPAPSADVPVEERLRRTMKLGPFELHYYAILKHTSTSVSTDAERYLFLGDRLFVFSTPFVTRRVLSAPPADSRPLSQSEAFQTLTAGWGDGSALQAASMGRASLLPNADVSAQVVVDGQGLAFRYGTTTDAKLEDISRAWSALPPGAIATVGAALPRSEDATPFEIEQVELMPTDVLPPVGLLHRTRGGAFGWYGEPGNSVWQQWLLVLPSDPVLLKTARAEGVRAPSATPKANRDGVHYVVRDGLLYLASDRALLERSLAQPLQSANDGEVVVSRGHFDGTRAGSVVASLPAPPEVDRNVLRFAGSLLSLVTDVRFSASWRPETEAGVLEGRVSLALRDPEDNSEVIDQWLASARLRNAAALPRPVGSQEAEGTLVYTLAVDDPETFARQSIVAGPRVQVEVRGEGHVVLTVQATASDDDATETLSAQRKKSLLKSSDVLRSNDPGLRTVTQSVAKDDMDANAKADAIVSWVHKRIAYEVMPRSVDAVEILNLGRGDCSEFARLTVAMLRAAGVPAEVRSGMAAQGSEMVAHAWVAYHDGKRWHEVDPTWGRSSVTAGHLPLEVMDVLALVSLDSLEIESIESRP